MRTLERFVPHPMATAALRGLLGILLATLLSTGPADRATAQDPDPAPGTTLTEEQINDHAHELSIRFMSPFCPGATLRDCTSGKAAEVRAEIRQWIAEGRDDKWIENTLVSRYGETVLSAPRFKGFNMLVWLFPIIAVLVGLGIIFAFLQRQNRLSLDQRAPSREVPDDFQPDPELESRLEEEISARTR